MRFEIMRLDDSNGNAVDSTVVDASAVNKIVQQAAAIGQRIYIRPARRSRPVTDALTGTTPARTGRSAYSGPYGARPGARTSPGRG